MKKIKSKKWKFKKCKLFKSLICFMVIMVSFYCCSYVDAGDYDSLLEKNRVDNVYAITKINGVNRIFYLNMYEMNGRVSYCIDLGVDIITDRYHSTTDFTSSYLSEEESNYIRSISYFGYGYDGHNDNRYYMAAQELIWEYLDNVEIEWSNEMKYDGNRIDIEDYKNDILNLIEEYNKKINFDLQNGQVFIVGEEIVLTDNNGVLSDYEVVSVDYSDVSIDDNELIIKVGNAIGREKITLRRKGYYDYESEFYYYDGSQSLISNGNYRKSDEMVEFDIKGVSLSGQVVEMDLGFEVDSIEATLEGAEYEIYDENNNLVGTYKTDKDGKFYVDNLLLGEYSIRQVKESIGYSINNKINNFVVNNDTKEIIIEQQLISNRFELRKVYGSDGNYKPEALVIFMIYDSNGNFYKYLITDHDGIEDFRLPYGKYVIKQHNSTSGYSMVEDFVIEVREQREVTDITYYNLVDELIKVKLKINNFEQESGELLSLKNFLYKIKDKNDNRYLEIDGKSVFEVGELGMLLISDGIIYGDYILEQVGVPKGILLSDKEIEFGINDTSKISLIDGNLVMELDFYNKIVKGNVIVKSLEEIFYKSVNNYGYKKDVRGNSSFSLIADKDIIFNNKIIYNSGEVVYNGVTDEEGNLIINNLYLGNYCLIDEFTNEKQCFILESVDNKVKLIEKELEFVKVLDKGNLFIKNISSKGDNIIDSVFEVVDNEGDVIYSGMTNEEGIIKVGNLLYGDYCIKQKSINSKYVINNEDICFSLTKDKNIEITNEILVKDVIKVPNTFSKSNGGYLFFVILAMIGTVIIVYKKIFKSKLYR